MRSRLKFATGLAALSLAAVPSGALAGHADQSAYINPDTGKASENADVNPDSSCSDPDVVDVQTIGLFSDKSNNVHVDGCIYGDDGSLLDTTVTFDVAGVGGVVACPDPDGEGPKTATASDNDGDGIDDRCTLSGYEDDNQQYHVRVVSEVPGATSVTMCTDPDGNGCADADQASVIQISWTGDLPRTGGGLLALSGLALAGAGALRGRRS